MEDKNTNFYKKNGYIITNIFSSNDIKILKNEIKKKIFQVTKKKIDLSNYHKTTNEEENSRITKNNKRFINVGNKIVKKIYNNKKVSQILMSCWGHSKFLMPDQKYLIGKIKKTNKKNLKKNEVQFRIVTPKKSQTKISAAPPPHVDINAAKITKKIINGKTIMHTSKIQLTLWTPLVGFSKKYSLRLAPGTHKYNHPVNKISNSNTKYVSPVFNKQYYQKFRFKRFELKKGQSILFDGNLIHGGAENLGLKSRVNLEFRLYNYKNVNL